MRKFILAVTLMALSGCDVFEADSETGLGAILFFSQPSQLVIPDTVNAGQPFIVNPRTFGDGCVSFARTELEINERIAEIRPYDRRELNVACPDLLKIIEHPVTLIFNTPGIVTVRVVGMRVPQNQEDTIERQVVIR